MFTHRNNLRTAAVRGQQENQKLLTDYVIKNHVQDPNRHNGQKNLYTSRRAKLITGRAKMMSPWKKRRQGLISKAMQEDCKMGRGD
jgi:uncharacterized protein YdiU (UPF0061 family)